MESFPDGSVGKESTCRRPCFDSWVRKMRWRRDRLPTPVFWSGEFHGLYSPWSCKESDVIFTSLFCNGLPSEADLDYQFKFLGGSSCSFSMLSKMPSLISMFNESEVLVAQACLTFCDSMDYSPPGSSVCGILQARILEHVAISLLQGIFPTQGSNLGLLHCRQIFFYSLSHQGSPMFNRSCY